jgi:hypothetical protein
MHGFCVRALHRNDRALVVHKRLEIKLIGDECAFGNTLRRIGSSLWPDLVEPLALQANGVSA